jgi:hypothetical protein
MSKEIASVIGKLPKERQIDPPVAGCKQPGFATGTKPGLRKQLLVEAV